MRMLLAKSAECSRKGWINVTEVRNDVVTFSNFGATEMSDEQFVAAVNATMPPGMKLIHAVCVSASRDRGEIVFSAELDVRFINVAGFISGGYLAHILDQTATAAATLMTGKAAPSIEFKTNFIAAARPGTFTATGSVVRVGKSIAFTEARLSDSEGKLIATAAVTSQLIAASRLVEKAVVR
jgi:uncharacterized protein (TIGR00369 family)